MSVNITAVAGSANECGHVIDSKGGFHEALGDGSIYGKTHIIERDRNIIKAQRALIEARLQVKPFHI